MQWHITRLRQFNAMTKIPCEDGIIDITSDVRPMIRIGTALQGSPRTTEDMIKNLALCVESSQENLPTAGYGDRIIIEKDPEHPEMVNVFVEVGGPGDAVHPNPTSDSED
jgi:hypothetical protein